ncbi:helix-turn-helix domain-containing protein [Chloroflexi bacterium TSY]|nr:helix-turn-helix domain-containing protein [Chloroflexi bacterium TSY]
MTVQETAEYAEVHPLTVYKWIKPGWIEAKQRYDRRWIIDKESVDQLLEGPPQQS